MTPAALAELVRATAVDVLSARGLDPAALPTAVTIERPRNPEHGDYATNLALQTAKKVGVTSRDLAGWLADALTGTDAISSVEVAGPDNTRSSYALRKFMPADGFPASRSIQTFWPKSKRRSPTLPTCRCAGIRTTCCCGESGSCGTISPPTTQPTSLSRKCWRRRC